MNQFVYLLLLLTQHRKNIFLSLSFSLSWNSSSEYRYDRNVRVLTQLFLLHIWPLLLDVQRNDILLEIIEKHRRLASKERRPRFCTNSLEHRIMLRSLQCLLCLTSVIKDSVRINSSFKKKIFCIFRVN
jgi:hypothetical protein